MLNIVRAIYIYPGGFSYNIYRQHIQELKERKQWKRKGEKPFRSSPKNIGKRKQINQLGSGWKRRRVEGGEINWLNVNGVVNGIISGRWYFCYDRWSTKCDLGTFVLCDRYFFQIFTAVTEIMSYLCQK